MLTLADIKAAARHLAEAVEATPCKRSRTLSQLTGADVTVKFENLQFTASFKERGALNRLMALNETQRKTGVIAMSAGNHAQGVAYHGKRLSVPVTIVMPRQTPFTKVKHTQDFGAEVILHGDTLQEAADYADRLSREKGLTFIHPFDDPLIVAGQGTVALEMLEAAPDLEVLLIPVGGGGLIGGCAIAAKAVNPAIEIIGVEAAAYPCMYRALHGEPAPADIRPPHTIAEGIAVKTAGRLPVEIARHLVDDILIVDEARIERAIMYFLEIEKTVAEGAGAAGLAALIAHGDRFRGRRVGLILSGGNIDSRVLASIIMRSMYRDGRILRLTIEIADQPGGLATIAGLIGKAGGNIIEVQHQRLYADISVKAANLDVVIETRDSAHGQRIVDALREAGFSLHRNESPSL